MSGKRMRVDDRYPVQLTTPRPRAEALTKKQVSALLKQLPFVRVIPELGNLTLRARTKDALQLKVDDAWVSALKNGTTPMSKAGLDFKRSRESANKRASKKQRKPQSISKYPLIDVPVGTQYGDWVTTSRSYYPETTVPGKRRVSVVDVQCSCGFVGGPRQVSELKNGRTTGCTTCAPAKRKQTMAVGATS